MGTRTPPQGKKRRKGSPVSPTKRRQIADKAPDAHQTPTVSFRQSSLRHWTLNKHASAEISASSTRHTSQRIASRDESKRCHLVKSPVLKRQNDSPCKSLHYTTRKEELGKNALCSSTQRRSTEPHTVNITRVDVGLSNGSIVTSSSCKISVTHSTAQNISETLISTSAHLELVCGSQRETRCISRELAKSAMPPKISPVRSSDRISQCGTPRLSQRLSQKVPSSCTGHASSILSGDIAHKQNVAVNQKLFKHRSSSQEDSDVNFCPHRVPFPSNRRSNRSLGNQVVMLDLQRDQKVNVYLIQTKSLAKYKGGGCSSSLQMSKSRKITAEGEYGVKPEVKKKETPTRVRRSPRKISVALGRSSSESLPDSMVQNKQEAVPFKNKSYASSSRSQSQISHFIEDCSLRKQEAKETGASLKISQYKVSITPKLFYGSDGPGRNYITPLDRCAVRDGIRRLADRGVKKTTFSKTEKLSPSVFKSKQSASKQASQKVDARKRVLQKLDVRKRVSQKVDAKRRVSQKVDARKRVSQKLDVRKRVSQKVDAKKRASQKVAAKKRVLQKVITKKRASQKVAAKKRVLQKIAAKKCASQKVAAKKGLSKKVATKKQALQKVATKKQALQKVATKKQALQKVATKKQALQKVATKKQALQKVATKKQALQKVATKKQALQKVTTKKQALQKVATKKQALQKVATKKQAFQKVATQKRASQKLDTKQHVAAKKLASQRVDAKNRAWQKVAAKKGLSQKVTTKKEALQKVTTHKRLSQKLDTKQHVAAKKLASQKVDAKNRAWQKVAAQKGLSQKVATKKQALQKVATQKRLSQKLDTKQHVAAKKLAAQKVDANNRAWQNFDAKKRASQKIDTKKRASQKVAAKKRASQTVDSKKHVAAKKQALQKVNAKKRASQKVAAKKQQLQKVATKKQESQKVATKMRASQKVTTKKQKLQKVASKKRVLQKVIANKWMSPKVTAKKCTSQKVPAKKHALQIAAKMRASQEVATKKRALQKVTPKKQASQKVAAKKRASQKATEENRVLQKVAVEKRASQKDDTKKCVLQKDYAKNCVLWKSKADCKQEVTSIDEGQHQKVANMASLSELRKQFQEVEQEGKDEIRVFNKRKMEGTSTGSMREEVTREGVKDIESDISNQDEPDVKTVTEIGVSLTSKLDWDVTSRVKPRIYVGAAFFSPKMIKQSNRSSKNRTINYISKRPVHSCLPVLSQKVPLACFTVEKATSHPALMAVPVSNEFKANKVDMKAQVGKRPGLSFNVQSLCDDWEEVAVEVESVRTSQPCATSGMKHNVTMAAGQGEEDIMEQAQTAGKESGHTDSGILTAKAVYPIFTPVSGANRATTRKWYQNEQPSTLQATGAHSADFSHQLLGHETLGSCDSPVSVKRRRSTSQMSSDCSSQSLSLRKLWRFKEKDGIGESQMIIDAGQKRFGAVKCGTCGMVYTAASPEDEAQHLHYHQRFVGAVKFGERERERPRPP
uniref:titin homolog isoform X2 n=1 Tax=Myxine glutinosa TaxID=7769 RepID=UPI00358E6C39